MLFDPSAVFSQAFQSPITCPCVEKQQNQVVIRITPVAGQGDLFHPLPHRGDEGFPGQKNGGRSFRRLLLPHSHRQPVWPEHRILRDAKKKRTGALPVSLTHTVANFTRKESPEIYFQSDNARGHPRRQMAPPRQRQRLAVDVDKAVRDERQRLLPAELYRQRQPADIQEHFQEQLPVRFRHEFRPHRSRTTRPKTGSTSPA